VRVLTKTSPTGKPKNNRGQVFTFSIFPGFTLIELSVVIFILGLSLAFVLPRLMSLSEAELKHGSRRLSGTLRYLFDQAAFAKTMYILRCDIKDGTYWVEYCLPEVEPPHKLQCWEDRALLGKKTRLPFGVRFQDVEIMGEKLGPDTEGGAIIPFFPDGYVPPAYIHIQDQRDKSFTLQLNPVTGRVKVLEGYVEAKTQQTSK